ncbi:MAG: hypothetical protein AAF661_16440 [Pseudomonadota bacterium]
MAIEEKMVALADWAGGLDDRTLTMIGAGGVAALLAVGVLLWWINRALARLRKGVTIGIVFGVLGATLSCATSAGMIAGAFYSPSIPIWVTATAAGMFGTFVLAGIYFVAQGRYLTASVFFVLSIFTSATANGVPMQWIMDENLAQDKRAEIAEGRLEKKDGQVDDLTDQKVQLQVQLRELSAQRAQANQSLADATQAVIQRRGLEQIDARLSELQVGLDRAEQAWLNEQGGLGGASTCRLDPSDPNFATGCPKAFAAKSSRDRVAGEMSVVRLRAQEAEALLADAKEAAQAEIVRLDTAMTQTQASIDETQLAIDAKSEQADNQANEVGNQGRSFAGSVWPTLTRIMDMFGWAMLTVITVSPLLIAFACDVLGGELGRELAYKKPRPFRGFVGEWKTLTGWLKYGAGATQWVPPEPAVVRTTRPAEPLEDGPSKAENDAALRKLNELGRWLPGGVKAAILEAGALETAKAENWVATLDQLEDHMGMGADRAIEIMKAADRDAWDDDEEDEDSIRDASADWSDEEASQILGDLVDMDPNMPDKMKALETIPGLREAWDAKDRAAFRQASDAYADLFTTKQNTPDDWDVDPDSALGRYIAASQAGDVEGQIAAYKDAYQEDVADDPEPEQGESQSSGDLGSDRVGEPIPGGPDRLAGDDPDPAGEVEDPLAEEVGDSDALEDLRADAEAHEEAGRPSAGDTDDPVQEKAEAVADETPSDEPEQPEVADEVPAEKTEPVTEAEDKPRRQWDLKAPLTVGGIGLDSLEFGAIDFADDDALDVAQAWAARHANLGPDRRPLGIAKSAGGKVMAPAPVVAMIQRAVRAKGSRPEERLRAIAAMGNMNRKLKNPDGSPVYPSQSEAWQAAHRDFDAMVRASDENEKDAK